jgi:hypothetical protein
VKGVEGEGKSDKKRERKGPYGDAVHGVKTVAEQYNYIFIYYYLITIYTINKSCTFSEIVITPFHRYFRPLCRRVKETV